MLVDRNQLAVPHPHIIQYQRCHYQTHHCQTGHSCLSGSAYHLHTQNNCRKVRSNVENILIIFSILADLCIMNLLQKDKLQTNITTLTPYSVHRKMWDQNYLQSGIWWIGLSPITMHLLNMLRLCINFWLNIK